MSQNKISPKESARIHRNAFLGTILLYALFSIMALSAQLDVAMTEPEKFQAHDLWKLCAFGAMVAFYFLLPFGMNMPRLYPLAGIATGFTLIGHPIGQFLITGTLDEIGVITLSTAAGVVLLGIMFMALPPKYKE